MNRRYLKLIRLALPANLLSCFFITGIGMGQNLNQMSAKGTFVPWQSHAKMHRFAGSETGDFRIGSGGIEFQAPNHTSEAWPYQDIQTFRLSEHVLTIKTYQNRKRPMFGIKQYRFDLDQEVPSSIAAEIAKEVQRPSQNAVPDHAVDRTDCVAIPAHHRTLTGGTNGVLHLCADGINYESSAPSDSRHWRWADLQTLADPDPNHLLIFGYRDTYSFDLKETLRSSLFYELVDALDAHDVGSAQKSSLLNGHRRGVGNE